MEERIKGRKEERKKGRNVHWESSGPAVWSIQTCWVSLRQGRKACMKDGRTEGRNERRKEQGIFTDKKEQQRKVPLVRKEGGREGKGRQVKEDGKKDGKTKRRQQKEGARGRGEETGCWRIEKRAKKEGTRKKKGGRNSATRDIGVGEGRKEGGASSAHLWVW